MYLYIRTSFYLSCVCVFASQKIKNKKEKEKERIKKKWKLNFMVSDWVFKGMFGNYFFPLFFISKNNFLFLRLKNLFDNPK